MFSSPAYAQTIGSAPGATGFAAYSGFIPIVLMVVIFYFLLIRPQQARAKQHKAMIEGAKKGDVVITGGGLVGRVIKVNGDEVEVDGLSLEVLSMSGRRVRRMRIQRKREHEEDEHRRIAVSE